MRTYTETELKQALEYQKTESYQMVGAFLIGSETPNIEGALNYLADDVTLSIDEVNEFLQS